MFDAIRKLSDREQLMVGVMALLLVAVLINLVIVSPILRMQSRAQADFARASRVADLTEGLEAPGEETADDRQLRSVVSELAASKSVVFDRIQTNPDGGLQMDLSNVPYSAFYTWLQVLEDEEGIVVTEAYITAGDEASSLEARVSLARGE